MKAKCYGWLYVAALVATAPVFADPPSALDANPQLFDAQKTFDSLATDARAITLRRGKTEFPHGGHFQGIQSYFDTARKTRVSFISGSSDSHGYFIAVTCNSDPSSVAEIRHLQFLPSDGQQPPLRHAGGMQLIGHYLVVGVEDNQRKHRSQIQFWDVSDPFAPKLREPLTVIREGTTPQDKTAGAVGIVKRMNNHVVVVANWDANALDFYESNGLPLGDDGCRFVSTMRWTRDTANPRAWKPNQSFGKYQSINLVCDREFNIFMLGFHTVGGKNVIDFFAVDLTKDSGEIIRMLSSKQINLKGDAQFQYSGGISIESSTVISYLATSRDEHAEIVLNVTP